MRPHTKPPRLPGAGNAHNLVPDAEDPDVGVCPCCGSVWKGGRPWTETTWTTGQLAEAMGQTKQNINQRIRTGTIVGYPTPGSRSAHLIPVFEVRRVLDVIGNRVVDLTPPEES